MASCLVQKAINYNLADIGENQKLYKYYNSISHMNPNFDPKFIITLVEKSLQLLYGLETSFRRDFHTPKDFISDFYNKTDIIKKVLLFSLKTLNCIHQIEITNNPTRNIPNMQDVYAKLKNNIITYLLLIEEPSRLLSFFVYECYFDNKT
mgnify:CR=1 FL=1